MTPQDVLDGKPMPRVSVKERHWYGVIYESGCLLCGAGSSREQRIRFPGEPPAEPSDRYATDERDWACNAHFM